MSTAPASQLIVTAPQLGQQRLSTRKRHKLTQTAVTHRLGLNQNSIPDEISVKQLLSWC